MPIQYKVVERGQPGVKGGGVKKYYASVAFDGELDIDQLVKRVEKFSALSEADIKGVIIALENVIQEALADSKIVRLEKLGSLYPSLSSNAADTAEEFHASLIRKVGVNYRPGKRILASIKEAGFQKKS